MLLVTQARSQSQMQTRPQSQLPAPAFIPATAPAPGLAGGNDCDDGDDDVYGGVIVMMARDRVDVPNTRMHTMHSGTGTHTGEHSQHVQGKSVQLW